MSGGAQSKPIELRNVIDLVFFDNCKLLNVH